MTLAILQEQVGHQADGWAYTLEELGRYYEQTAGKKVVGSYLNAAALLGRRTAELHEGVLGRPR